MKKLSVLLTFALGLVLIGCGGSSGPAPIVVSLSPSTAQAIDNGQSVNVTAAVTNDSLNKGVTWSLTGAGALASSTTTSVTYNAPASGAAATATITATSVADATKTATLTVSVSPVPAISTTTLPASTEGTAYTQAIAATGGAGTLNFTISAGTLPAGLTMDATGHITGTPTGPNGTSNFTVKITDSSTATPQTATQALSILVNLPTPPSITTTTLPAAVEGTAYNQTIQATGGVTPYTFTISSVTGLPAGLSMDTAGHVTGTPTGPNATANFTVKVTDKSNPAQSGTQNLSIAVNLPSPPAITTTTLPAGVEQTAYDQTLQANSGLPPYTFTVTAGTLPPGLTMNTSGHITGSPLGPNGTSNFTAKVTDSSNPPQSGTQNLSIVVNLKPAPVISPASLPNGNVGTPYNQVLTVTGGQSPFTWTVSSGTLPAGLVLTPNGTTATISGTPTTTQASVAFTIRVTDTSNPTQSGSQAYTVTINPPTPLAITTNSPLPQGTFNTAYTTTITAAGGVAPYTFSLDGASNPLPAGLALSNSSNQGVISGTPSTAGTFTLIVDVTDTELPTPVTAKKTFTLVITAPAIVISPSTASLPSGTQGTAYTTNISASGGVSPYTFSLDATSATLPAGLGFSSNSSSATISGTPTASGTTSNIIVDVKDSEQPQVTQKITYSLTINPSAVACGSGSESKLNGQYAFLLQGFDASGPVAIGGSFTADGTGKITAGQEDVNRSASAPSNPSITTASSSYSVGADNRGCMTIAAGGTTSTYRIALSTFTSGVAAKAHIIGFDATGINVMGTVEKQDPTAFSIAQFSGDYAFGVSAAKAGGGRFGIAGRFTAAAGSITAAVADADDSSGGPQSVPTFTGTYTVAANGRGTITLTPGGPTVHASFYVVSANEALFMSIDPQGTNSLFGGSILKQVGGPFGISALNGTDVIQLESLGSTAGTSNVQVGLLVPAGNGTFTFTVNSDDGGTVTANPAASGNYSVVGNGRVTITGAGSHPPVLYLVSQDKGFIVGTDSSATTGFFEPQTGGPFSNSSASGNYAFGGISPIATGNSDQSGVATFTSPNVTGTNDRNVSGALSAGNAFSATYSIDSTGLGLMPANCSISGGTCQNIFFIISPTKWILMETASGKTNPNLQGVDK